MATARMKDAVREAAKNAEGALVRANENNEILKKMRKDYHALKELVKRRIPTANQREDD